MVLPIVGGNESKGYEISNSLRFNDADSPHLTRTPSSSGNRRTWTMSCWFKKCEDSLNHTLFSTTGTQDIRFASNERLLVYGESKAILNTNRLFRDPSAWYHIVVATDTTQSTSSNRVKLYVNGTQETDFETNSQPSQNYDWNFNHTVEQGIGERVTTGGLNPHGYLADFHWIDGQQLDPTYFGETNDNGVWIPKKYTGTYGTNGFFMEFQQTGTSANSSGIGADTSGNDNHLTPANLTATDITEDTPTNNFATFNPLFVSRFDNDGVLLEGNCQSSFDTNSNRGYAVSTLAVTQGKWYWEVKVTDTARMQVGVCYINEFAALSTAYYDNNPSQGFGLDPGANISYDATSTTYGSTISANDIVMMALDMDNHLIWAGLNGSWFNSATVSEIEAGTATNDMTTKMGTQQNLNSGEPVAAMVGDVSTTESSQFQINFGNPPYAISSGNNDGKYGNFEYAPPSGFYALCTKRLAEFG
jgi:hypothetical protein